MSQKLIMGNWKMFGRDCTNFTLVNALLENSATSHDHVVLCAPYVYLAPLACQLKEKSIKLAAQDVSQFDEDGAYTGEVSAQMLKDIGCTYVLIGHSERRQYFKEDNVVLLQKIKNAQKAGLIPVLCVGEQLSERDAGTYMQTITEQLSILKDVDAQALVVAYEPVWAIGTGRVATELQIEQTHAQIKAWLLQNIEGSDNIALLYGGSVKPENAHSILSQLGVDGALVGGASLNSKSFAGICEAAYKTI